MSRPVINADPLIFVPLRSHRMLKQINDKLYPARVPTYVTLHTMKYQTFAGMTAAEFERAKTIKGVRRARITRDKLLTTWGGW